ncbi:MAG: hypothetical protein GM46_10490 [actinobacterium acAcidi]|nr:MAG: hypothetical protein GM46_10490 [actinobacterium acAcidi]
MKKILAGLFAASLVVVSCGGDDSGVDSNDRDALIEMFTADGDMSQEVAECMADATIDTMSDEDMKSMLSRRPSCRVLNLKWEAEHFPLINDASGVLDEIDLIQHLIEGVSRTNC